MKTRAAALALCMAAVLTAFTGCSTGSTDETGGTVSTADEKEDRSGMEFYLTYPDYNTKAFTVSYDDGTIQDKKVMSLAK